MGLDNPIHIAFLLILLLLVFGAKRLPEMGKSLGTGMRGFKDALSGEESPNALLAHQHQAAVATAPIQAQQPVTAPVQAQPVQAPVQVATAPIQSAPAPVVQTVAEPLHVAAQPVGERVPA